CPVGSAVARTAEATATTAQPLTVAAAATAVSPRAYRARVSTALSPYPSRPGANAAMAPASSAGCGAPFGITATSRRAPGSASATSAAAPRQLSSSVARAARASVVRYGSCRPVAALAASSGYAAVATGTASTDQGSR